MCPGREWLFDVDRKKKHGMKQPCDGGRADLPGNAYARSLAKTDITCQRGYFF
jgi:hypothetical protein